MEVRRAPAGVDEDVHSTPPDLGLPMEPRTADLEEWRARQEAKRRGPQRATERAAAAEQYAAAADPERFAPAPFVDEPPAEPPVAAAPVVTPPSATESRVQQTARWAEEYLAGDGLEVIAARAGVTANTVRGRLVAAGVTMRQRGAHSPAAEPRRDVTDEERHQLVELYGTGQSIPSLARAFGRSTATVRRVLLAAGVRLRDDRATNSGSKPKEYPQAIVDQVRALYVGQGLTQAEVADRLGTSTKVVQTVMHNAGIPARPDATGKAPEPRPPAPRETRYTVPRSILEPPAPSLLDVIAEETLRAARAADTTPGPPQTAPEVCPDCTAGDHRWHRPTDGDACVGCPCDWRPTPPPPAPAAPAPTPRTQLARQATALADALQGFIDATRVLLDAQAHLVQAHTDDLRDLIDRMTEEDR